MIYILTGIVFFIVPILASFVSLLTLQRVSGNVLLGFSSGVLLSVAFIHLFPEAMESFGANAGILSLLGIVIPSTLDSFFFGGKEQHYGHYSEVSAQSPLSVKIICGLSMHSLFDGLILGTTIPLSKSFIAVLVAILLHKIFDGISISGVFLSTGSSKKRTIFIVMIISSISTLGYFFGVVGVGFVNTFGVFLSLSAGLLTYVAIHDLLPLVENIRGMFFVSIGVAVVILLSKIM